MSLKLKMLGLGVLAVMATSAFAAVNASAKVSGHFTSEVDHVVLKGEDSFGKKHQLEFQEAGGGTPISCTDATYTGTLSEASATTTQEVEIQPEYKNCATTSGVWNEVTVEVQSTASCGKDAYKFTSATPNAHGTVHIQCHITIKHPNCTLTIAPQTPAGGITYTTSSESGKHEITGDVTVTDITATRHQGICIFLGTTGSFNMNGTTTLWGQNSKAERINITAT